jgi:ribosomal protein L30/L7E
MKFLIWQRPFWDSFLLIHLMPPHTTTASCVVKAPESLLTVCMIASRSRLVFLCCYLLYYNNLYYVKTSNIVLGLVTKIVVRFYTDFTSWLLKQIWLFPYPYGFCKPEWIHGMKINDMIWYDMLQPHCYSFTVMDSCSNHQTILSMHMLVAITMWQPSILRSTVDLLTGAWVGREEEISSTLRIKKRNSSVLRRGSHKCSDNLKGVQYWAPSSQIIHGSFFFSMTSV